MFSDCYYPRVNGVVVSVHSFVQELVNRGHIVKVITVEYPDDYQFNRKGYSDAGLIDSPNFSLNRLSSKEIIFSKEDRLVRLKQWHILKGILDEFQPDILHINSEWLVGYFGAIYAHHRKVPCIFTFHTLWEDYIQNYAPILREKISKKIGRDIVKFYLKTANHILAPTPQTAQTVRKYGIDTPVELLPTGIPESMFKLNEAGVERMREEVFSNFPQLKDRKILLFAGRVAKEKNLPFLLPVLKRVNQLLERAPSTSGDTTKRAALLVAGDGNFLQDLKDLVEQQQLAQDVFYLGYVERDDLASLYHLADVFTFPSKTETQGLVTVEAMTAGLPVVAIGEMGTIDVMQGDNGGFMVPEDVEIFSQKVFQLLTDGTLYQEKSREGRAWSRRWGMSALTDRLEAAYATCIADHRAGKKTGGSELDKALSATTVLTIIGLGYIFG
ncbi:MAG: glycosyltransferase [Spirochaetaceae bacterium]|nr:glycosyltransferase [Spirochaetaceae bacterium]